MPGAAGNNALPVFRADQEGTLLDTGNNTYAGGLRHDLVGNRLVRSRHDCVQDVFRVVDALIDRCLIVRCIG